MNPSILNSKDFWAGLMLIAIGAAAIFLARDYTFGTALRMGPGFFPIVLGAVLILFGLYILATGLRDGAAIEGSWSRADEPSSGEYPARALIKLPRWPLASLASAARALIILPLALILFGLLMEHAGFVPAMLVLIFASALASTEFKLLEVLLFALGLSALSVAVFIWGLGLPYPLFMALD